MKTILVMAATIDGKIARNPNHHVNWTGRKDKQLFVQLTREAGVIIMGSNTYDTIGEPLPGRKNIVLTRNKDRVSDHKDLIFTDSPPARILEELENEGYETVALIGGSVVNSIFLKEKLIQEIYLTIVPKIFGTGLSMFDQKTELNLDPNLELVGQSKLDSHSVLLKYLVTYQDEKIR